MPWVLLEKIPTGDCGDFLCALFVQGTCPTEPEHHAKHAHVPAHCLRDVLNTPALPNPNRGMFT